MDQELNGEEMTRLTRTSSQICPTPEEELLEAVIANDIPKIRHIILKNKYLLSYNYSEYFNYTILQISCYEDGVNAETVNTLLELKANPRDRTKDCGWTALHLAAYKTNYNVLKVLLRNNPEPGDVNVTDKFGQNALHILIRYKYRRSPDFLKCAELLVRKGINVNSQDYQTKTPIYWAEKEGVGHAIKRIIAQSLNTENYFPQLSIEGQFLMKYLEQHDEKSFINFKNGDIEDLANYSDESSTLLQKCCERGLVQAAIHLLNRGADENLTTHENTLKPVEIAAENGYTEIFKILLDKHRTFRLPVGLAARVLKYMVEEKHLSIECYRIFVKKLWRSDADEASIILNQIDDDHNTALHYAIGYADHNIIEELLALGASLGAKNRHNRMVVQDIDPEILEKHLDKCVKFNNKDRVNANFEVSMSYRSIIPPCKTYAENIRSGSLEYDFGRFYKSGETIELVPESEVVFFMSKASKYRHLLKHPVIASFLFVKWLKIQWLFWVNLAFYATFALSLIIYILTDYTDFSKEVMPLIRNLSYALLFFTLIVLVIRELFQIYMAPTEYFKNFENCMEILLIVPTAMIVFMNVPSADTRKQLSSLSILLAIFEFVLMLGIHPYFSPNVVMLRTVSLNFFKFLMWYSLLIIAFALSFYLLFTTQAQATGNGTAVSNVDEGDKSFDTPGRSLFKTIIMLTGEFDASSINFDTFPVTSRLIFVLFIIMIAIILLNLLNGLAVSDTQMIKNDAELVGYISRAQHIRYVESVLNRNILPTKVIKKLGGICCYLQARLNWENQIAKMLGTNEYSSPSYIRYGLTFYPNNKGLIEKYSLNYMRYDHYKFDVYFAFDYYLDQETVKRTKSIIDQATRHEKRKNDWSHIRKMEKDLEALNKKIDLIFRTNTTVQATRHDNLKNYESLIRKIETDLEAIKRKMDLILSPVERK